MPDKIPIKRIHTDVERYSYICPAQEPLSRVALNVNIRNTHRVNKLYALYLILTIELRRNKKTSLEGKKGGRVDGGK